MPKPKLRETRRNPAYLESIRLLSSCSVVFNSVTPWTAACQAPCPSPTPRVAQTHGHCLYCFIKIFLCCSLSFFLGSGPFQKERDDSNFVLSKSTQAKCGSIWMPGPSIPAALTPKHSREWRVNRRRLPLPAQEPLPVFGLETSQQEM